MTSSLSKPNTDPMQNCRTAVIGVLYAGVIAASFFLAYEIRFDFLVPPEFQQMRLQLLWIVVGFKIIALIAARQLGSLMTYFSIPDFVRLLGAMLATSLLLLAVRLVGGIGVGIPRGVLLIDFMLCTGGLCAGRLGARMIRERINGNRHNHGSIVQQQRIGIIGAGDAGAALAKEFLTNPSRGFKPVVFFDDDAKKHGKLVHGVPVLGKPEAIASAKHPHSLSKVIIAMPTAPARRVRQVVQLMAEHHLKVETLPSMADLASGRVKATRIRPVEVEDLLGRETVHLDSEGIRKSITGRVVLVTGAGGSIGSELCRQIAAQAPKQLLLVEQSEPSLFLIEQELNELGLGTLAVPLVADILDEERMRYIFAHYRPEVVFHAAAHKHVFMMERQPAEAIRNNVLGTRQLAEIAADAGVDTFVLISTDKAINPTNVMGATKRLAELQLLAIAAQQGASEKLKSGNAEKLKSDFSISASQRLSVSKEAEADTLRAAEAMLAATAKISKSGNAEMLKSDFERESRIQNPEFRSPISGGGMAEDRKSGKSENWETLSKGERRKAEGETDRASLPSLPPVKTSGAGIEVSRETRTIGFGASNPVVARTSLPPEIVESEVSDEIVARNEMLKSGNAEMLKSGFEGESRIQNPESRSSDAEDRKSGKSGNWETTEGISANTEKLESGFGVSSGGRRRQTKFMAVRFGNVLGSSGSVIPIFKRQIAHGGPVTVTHAEVTRYFMTIPEAVGLVLQTSILGKGGEIFVLDMGHPVKIVDLAKQMIELSGFKVGEDIEIKFTGLKPGEKLYEELQHKTEQYTATDHPRIMRFTTTAMFSESGVQELRRKLYELDSNQLKLLLKRLVPEYTPFLD